MIDKMFAALDRLIDRIFKSEKANAACKKVVNKVTISYMFYGILTTVINIAVHMLTYNLLTDSLGEAIALNIAITVSWVAAVLFAFITNKFFVFGSKSTEAKLFIREGLAFFGGRLFSYLFELIWNNVTVIFLKMPAGISKILGQFVIVIMNYFVSKFFVFKNKTEVKNDRK